MKKCLFLLAFLATSITLSAQTKSINLELLGSNGLAGINYDARFDGNSGFGYNVGFGVGYSDYGFVYTDYTSLYKGISYEFSVPFEINYLFGKNNHHLVLGAGGACAIIQKYMDVSRQAFFGLNLFADVAYRYQRPEGFTFAIGAKPMITNSIRPYITLGYSF